MYFFDQIPANYKKIGALPINLPILIIASMMLVVNRGAGNLPVKVFRFDICDSLALLEFFSDIEIFDAI